MAETSVDAIVEKMVKTTPVAKVTEDKSVPEAPVVETPVKSVDVNGKADAQAKSDDAAALTTFEQELITEYQEEYDSAGDQSAFLNALKRSYRKQAKQMTELGTLRKAVSTLRDAGITNDDLVELVNRKKGKSSAVSDTNQKATEDDFESLIAKTTDPVEREDLLRAERVVRKVVEKLVKPLEEKLNAAERKQLDERQQTLDQEINDLEDKHGFKGSLVETYRDAMRTLGLRNPKLSARKLLQIVSTDEEYDQGRVVKAAESGEKPKGASSVVKK